ncbi:protein kinase domain-containing protein [Herbidospora mongoliensis]|uniref:serine/threonine-protein kinase n=1 Tax=Herbidospora mongoliensis TaxID=688067 RepID=UPI003F6EBA5B
MVEAYVKACGGGPELVQEMERRRRRAKAEDLARRREQVRPLAARGPLEVGGFRLWARLGTGAMGQVYLGERADGEVAAVKVIRPDLADDPLFRRRFAHEVRALSAVDSLHVASFVDADPDPAEGQPWLAVAYVPGPSLRDASPLPAPVVTRIATGLAEALAAVHAAGIVHRDLKPGNILLTEDGPRLIDFGISRSLDGTQLTLTGQRVGTPAFMAPEEIADDRHTGPAADVFAFGSVLVYALTGRPPFGEGPTEQAVLRRVVEQPPDLSGITDTRLRDLIERCLAKNPDDRPTTDDLLRTCTALIGGSPGALQDETAVTVTPPRRERPHRAGVLFLVLIPVIVISVTVVSITVILPQIRSESAFIGGDRLTSAPPESTPAAEDTPAVASTPTGGTPAAEDTPPVASTPQPSDPGSRPVETPSGDLPGEVNEERQVRLHATEPGFASVEIDYWRQELDNPTSTPNGDLWMKTDHVHTAKSAALAKVESSPDATPTRCARITAWTNRVDFADLQPGDQLCARSAEGRYAMLRIESLPTSPQGDGYFAFYGRVWKQMRQS